MPISKQLSILQVAVLEALFGEDEVGHYTPAQYLHETATNPVIRDASLAQVRFALGRLWHLGLVNRVVQRGRGGVRVYCRKV